MSAPRLRRTKIVCTLGPATSTPEAIEQLAWEGMDAARLNFSHGTRDEQRARLRAVRDVQRLIGRPLAVLADLQGPKIRVAGLTEPRPLNPGDLVALAPAARAAPGELGVSFDGLGDVAVPGGEVLIDDGRIRLRVAAVLGARVEAVVEVGGVVSPAKGVNLPGMRLPIPSLTEKDVGDLEFALAEGVDYVALSFVRSAEDIVRLREHIEGAGSPARVIAKIEKAEALENLEGIVAASDGVMVARGDLGVEIGVADVPLVQKRIIALARDAGRVVITATQMLESMIRAPEPTRAEASDVANAILDGTSAVMLSGETAMGRYPTDAVMVMNRIARAVEPALGRHDPLARDARATSAILSHAACQIAEDLDAAVIAVPTQSGLTAREVSRFRPRRTIVAVSPHEHVLQQLALEWAVVPVAIQPAGTTEDLWRETGEMIAAAGLAERGDTVVVTGGTRLNVSGTTDHIRVQTI